MTTRKRKRVSAHLRNPEVLRPFDDTNAGALEERRVRLDQNGEAVCDYHGDQVRYHHDAAASISRHMRHTYVVMTYHAMKKAGNKNPWKTISEAIGHRHIATTIDTYAKHVAIDEGELGDAVGALLSSLDGEIAR